VGDYTPGPWFVMPEDPPMRRSRLVMDQPNLEPDGPRMALAYVWGRTDEIAEANARLVAAAPELLAACKSIKEDLEDRLLDTASPGTRQTLRAQVDLLDRAIAKAEGREGRPSVDSSRPD
jgi:hypothetical protein